MDNDWRKYQEKAASFFRSLGFMAVVDKKVCGARGKHKIDVWVTGQVQGISFRWVIECKDWKRNISKEKVLALMSIVQDIGADRGFLLSEIGFQSGAIRVSQKSNVTLSSIVDLKIVAEDSSHEISAANIYLRLNRMKDKLLALHKNTDEYYSEYSRELGKLCFIEFAVRDALNGKFPAIYTVTKNEERLSAKNWEELIEAVSKIMGYIEKYISKHSRTKKPKK